MICDCGERMEVITTVFKEHSKGRAWDSRNRYYQCPACGERKTTKEEAYPRAPKP